MQTYNPYDDYINRLFLEVPTLTYILGVEPIQFSETNIYTDWMDNVIQYHINELTELIKMNCPQYIRTSIENNTSLINNVIVNSYIETINCLKRFITNGIAINISQISKYTQEMGFFELCAKGIINTEGYLYIDSANQQTYTKERTTKNYDVVKISQEFKDSFDTKAHSRDTAMRINAKAMCFDNNNIPVNTYINCLLHWVDPDANDLPIYDTMFAYTILSNFRKLDSSIKAFNGYMHSGNTLTKKETRRLTRNLHKNYFALTPKVFKSIDTNDTFEQYTDKYLFNYAMEKCFHFQFIPQILYARKLIMKHYPNIDERTQHYIDTLLINLTNLPNSFSRTSTLIEILHNYFGIKVIQNNGLLNEVTEQFVPMDINIENLNEATKYIMYLSRVFFPTIQKVSMFSFYETTRQSNYQFKYPNITEMKTTTGIFDMTRYSSEILYSCKEAFLDKYINPNLSTKQTTEQHNNYLLSQLHGYIKRPTDNITAINMYEYGYSNIENLSPDEIDFLTKLFSQCFSIEQYNMNIDVLFTKGYFGLTPNHSSSTIQKELLEETTKSYMNYIINDSNMF